MLRIAAAGPTALRHRISTCLCPGPFCWGTRTVECSRHRCFDQRWWGRL